MSRGVQCEDRVVPLGVVACVVPFNFPLMVPMWTVPIALALGNCVILKPSEKVPMTMRFVAKLFTDAGVPEGVFATVNGGGGDLVNAIIDHEDIQAVTFVGSTPIARIVANRCKGINKRCLALGGAKNHLIALKDCDINGTVRDVVTSSFGCAGQRCMASSAFVVIGEQPELMAKLKEEVGKIKLGVSQGGELLIGCEKLAMSVLWESPQREGIGAPLANSGSGPLWLTPLFSQKWAQSSHLRA